MRTSPWNALVLLGGLVGGVVAADVVTTKDGLVLEGRVKRGADGSVVVTTEAGEVRLASDAVGSVAPGEGPRAKALAEIAAIAPGDAEAHYRQALACQAAGLADLAERELRAVIVAEPGHPAARRALGYEQVDGAWLTVAEARRARGLVNYEGKWILPQEVDRAAGTRRRVAPKDPTVASAMRKAALAEPALARAATERLSRAPARERVETATALLLDGDPRVRKWAAGELASLGDEAGLRPLLASAVRDRDAEVRLAAVKAAATFGHDDAAVPLVLAMWSEHDGIVANAARALASLGDRRAVRYVVKRIESHGSSPRSYFSHLQQQSYIRDFDVEVAQTSSIADPQIGIIQEGTVQDAQVLDAMIQKTIVEKVLIDSFNSLAGTSFKQPDQVAAWFRENGAGLPDFPPVPAARRASSTK
jgi:hypothetical protein